VYKLDSPLEVEKEKEVAVLKEPAPGENKKAGESREEIHAETTSKKTVSGRTGKGQGQDKPPEPPGNKTGGNGGKRKVKGEKLKKKKTPKKGENPIGGV